MKSLLAISILVAAASALLATEPAKEKSALPPPPVSDKIYTFAQIEKQKAELKDKVIRIEIMQLVAGPADLLANGTHRYIVEDTSKGATPYGQVGFPREGLEKMGLANDPPREGPFSVYPRARCSRQSSRPLLCYKRCGTGKRQKSVVLVAINVDGPSSAVSQPWF